MGFFKKRFFRTPEERKEIRNRIGNMGRPGQAEPGGRMLCIGVAGSSSSVGTTHLAILTAAYLSGVLRKKTAVLEWNGTEAFVDLEKILSKKAVTKENGKTFNMLGIFFCKKAGAEAFIDCTEQGFEAVVADFGCYRGSIREEFLRCDRRFLVCSGSDWQLLQAAELIRKEFTQKNRVEYFSSFGTEETLRMAEKHLKVQIRRIPFSPDAFVITGESMAFFGKFLKYGY